MKKPESSRPFTKAEIREVEKITGDGFKGRFVDMDRCSELISINLQEYSAIGKRVRNEIREQLSNPTGES